MTPTTDPYREHIDYQRGIVEASEAEYHQMTDGDLSAKYQEEDERRKDYPIVGKKDRGNWVIFGLAALLIMIGIIIGSLGTIWVLGNRLR